MVDNDLDTDDACTCPPLRNARPGWRWWSFLYLNMLAIGMGSLTLLIGRGSWLTGALLVANIAVLSWHVMELCWRYEALEYHACNCATQEDA